VTDKSRYIVHSFHSLFAQITEHICNFTEHDEQDNKAKSTDCCPMLSLSQNVAFVKLQYSFT